MGGPGPAWKGAWGLIVTHPGQRQAPEVIRRLKPAAVEQDMAVLRTHGLPELGTLPLSGITREQVNTMLQGELMEGQYLIVRDIFAITL